MTSLMLLPARSGVGEISVAPLLPLASRENFERDYGLSEGSTGSEALINKALRNLI